LLLLNNQLSYFDSCSRVQDFVIFVCVLQVRSKIRLVHSPVPSCSVELRYLAPVCC